MIVEDPSCDANPLVLGGIEIGLATACAMLMRGVLHELLEQPSCTSEVVQAIYAHVVPALAGADALEFGELVDELERLLELAREGRVWQ